MTVWWIAVLFLVNSIHTCLDNALCNLHSTGSFGEVGSDYVQQCTAQKSKGLDPLSQRLCGSGDCLFAVPFLQLCDQRRLSEYTQDYEQGTGERASDERREAGTVGNADTETDVQEANTAQQILVAEAASVSEVKEIAHNNLLVYIAADKFGTDSLKGADRGLFTANFSILGC
uniref:Breast cancer type 2 susceptibility protein like n=1 Tax=Talaromyces marneffei PM1 TaxID=1077442 RepID=A0A093UXU2_TALMA